MTYVKQPLTNSAYGKRDSAPAITPMALACIHITGNERTAAYTDLHAAAQAEWKYANRAGSGGPSAHFYVARDGWAIMAINPNLYWAWSNGDVKSPNRANPGVDRVLKATHDKGINANRAYWLEFENVGYGKTYPVNAKQRQFCAEQIAAMAKTTGLPVNRATVHGHWEINGVDRQTCPSPNHEGFLDDVIARAQAILNPPEADVPQLATYIPGQLATLKALSNVRDEPKITAKVLRTLDAPETWAVTGWTKGDVDPESGSDLWICRWAGGRWEYTAKVNLSAGPAAPVDSTPFNQVELDAARADGYAAAKTKALAAVSGI